jgi:Chaperone of endosialidase
VKTFHYKQDSRFPKGERIGLIAQEVEKVIPSAVTKARIRRTNDASNIKMIEMDQLVMHLLATVQSLTKRIEELEKK